MKRVYWLALLPAVLVLLALPASAEASSKSAQASSKFKLDLPLDNIEYIERIAQDGSVKVIVKLNVSLLDVKQQRQSTSSKAKGRSKLQAGKISFVDNSEFSNKKSEVLKAARQSKGTIKSASEDFSGVKGNRIILASMAANAPAGLEQVTPLQGFRKFLPKLELPTVPVQHLLQSLSSMKGSSVKSSDFKVKDLKIIGAIAMELPPEKLADLAASSAVLEIRPVREYSILLTESVPYINATGAWALLDSSGTNITGTGVKIAVIDTGVDYSHADLGGCTSQEFLSGNCSKVAGGYDFYNYDSDPMDDHGHGTHVAATAAGNGALLGVAPDAIVLAYKALSSSGSGDEIGIILSVEDAVALGAQVISMSLGGSYCYPPDSLEDAVSAAVDAGVVVVIAAGNNGPAERSVVSPGCTPKALTVAAACSPSMVNSSGYCPNTNIASFSSRGPAVTRQKPDISAPGVDICAARFGSYGSTTCVDSSHIKISGTSMATPHVSGAVALMLQKHTDWSPEQVKAALKFTATPLGTSRLSEGAGLINVGAAVALEAAPPVAILEEVSNLALE